MANRLGSGNDPTTAAAKLGGKHASRVFRAATNAGVPSTEVTKEKAPPAKTAAPAIEVGPTVRLAALVADVLASHDERGLRVPDLCDRLTEKSVNIRAALARLVRTGRVRRIGARSRTRYVLNV